MRAIRFLRLLGRDRSGATAIEYGLIVALLCIAIIGALQGVANENTGMWAVVKERITAVMTP